MPVGYGVGEGGEVVDRDVVDLCSGGVRVVKKCGGWAVVRGEVWEYLNEVPVISLLS